MVQGVRLDLLLPLLGTCVAGCVCVYVCFCAGGMCCRLHSKRVGVLQFQSTQACDVVCVGWGGGVNSMCGVSRTSSGQSPCRRSVRCRITAPNSSGDTQWWHTLNRLCDTGRTRNIKIGRIFFFFLLSGVVLPPRRHRVISVFRGFRSVSVVVRVCACVCVCVRVCVCVWSVWRIRRV